jgi:hypothetical protein
MANAELSSAPAGDIGGARQLRYRFTVGDREFERLGPSLADDQYEASQADAIAQGRIEILYLREDPSINEPIAGAESRCQIGLIAMAAGILIGVAALWALSMVWGRP